MPTSELCHLVAWPCPLVPISLSTVGLLPPPGFLPLVTKVASCNKGGNQTCSPRSQLCGRDTEPPRPRCSPAFTEFSGVVLSALATENLCVCVGVGGCPCLTPPSPPCTPQCLPRSAGAGVLLPPGPTTLPKICVCTSRLGGGSPEPPGVCAMSCLWGCHFSRGGEGEGGGEAFSALRISVAFTSQSSERQCHLFLVLGPK